METSFSTNRLWLLIKRYFVESKQRELTFWGISLVVFMLMRDQGSIITYLIIAGYFTAANAFRIFGHTPGGMHYLLIPATHTEKLVTSILINTIYFFVAFLITYIAGAAIGISLDNLIFGHNYPIQFNLFTDKFSNQLDLEFLWWSFYAFAIVQAIAITGSLYFKRSAAMKTLLSLFIIFVVLGIFEISILKLMFGTYEISNRTFNLSPHDIEELFPALKTIFKIIGYLILPFFWSVSYFRLTEKQV